MWAAEMHNWGTGDIAIVYCEENEYIYSFTK